jgi:hypothetical protein
MPMTNNDVDEIDVMSDSLPKMPSPPPTVVKKRKRGNFTHISRVCHSSLLCTVTVSGPTDVKTRYQVLSEKPQQLRMSCRLRRSRS